MPTHVSYTPDEISSIISDLDTAEQRVKALTAERDALATRLAQAEQDVRNVRTSYRHEIYELRERVAGTFTGMMDRLLEAALLAAKAEPPRIPVIIERVELITEMIAAFVAKERNPA
ncbi:MAG: hypothetical protein WCG26_12285 [Chloroflexales bacterium]